MRFLLSIFSSYLKPIVKPKEVRTCGVIESAFVHNTDKRVFSKRYECSFPTQERVYMENEYEVMQMVGAKAHAVLKENNIEIPEILNIIRTRDVIEIQTKLFVGETIERTSILMKLDILERLVTFLESLHHIQPIPNGLGRRSILSLFLTSFIWTGVASLRNIRLMPTLLLTQLYFCWLYIPRVFESVSLSLTHRDLDANNIKVQGEKVFISDWENAVWTDPLYDLSQLPRLYAQYMSTSELLTFCRTHLHSLREEKYVKALSIYGIHQSLAVDGRSSQMYIDALKTQNALLPEKKTLYEYGSSFVFWILSNIYTLLPFLYAPVKGGIVLCYHSVGYTDWRYTIPPYEFSKHIQALKKHFKIQSVEDVVRTNNGVAITFDDGYADLLTHALPICKKHKISPTVFVLGLPERANRGELDNDLPLLSVSGVKTLQTEGWGIGYHTDTHGPLASLDSEKLKRELSSGKEDLERKLHQKLRSFAYPKGFHSPQIREMIYQAKFDSAFTVDGGMAKRDNPYLYDRVPLERDVDARRLLAELSPVGMGINMFFLRILQIKENLRQKIMS